MGSSAYTRVEAVELRLGLFLTRHSRHVEDDLAAVYAWKLYRSQSRSNEMRWCRRGTVGTGVDNGGRSIAWGPGRRVQCFSNSQWVFNTSHVLDNDNLLLALPSVCACANVRLFSLCPDA